eukprot:gnl/TRDRNA2_/TRDRNA2_138603_c1_seq1.p1 gnl/TRDRNA2_/TRDRNA2_138603_c1~~gnl/TRDRNA2_/TRDRNA2_138603_c1_seq1.p1  ORF type:complete len:211 (+),score=48.14 gnl/TRDRNA2_/TRDRNA2_138603_c1_seq1:95-634(+)
MVAADIEKGEESMAFEEEARATEAAADIEEGEEGIPFEDEAAEEYQPDGLTMVDGDDPAWPAGDQSEEEEAWREEYQPDGFETLDCDAYDGEPAWPDGYQSEEQEARCEDNRDAELDLMLQMWEEDTVAVEDADAEASVCDDGLGLDTSSMLTWHEDPRPSVQSTGHWVGTIWRRILIC